MGILTRMLRLKRLQHYPATEICIQIRRIRSKLNNNLMPLSFLFVCVCAARQNESERVMKEMKAKLYTWCSFLFKYENHFMNFIYAHVLRNLNFIPVVGKTFYMKRSDFDEICFCCSHQTWWIIRSNLKMFSSESKYAGIDIVLYWVVLVMASSQSLIFLLWAQTNISLHKLMMLPKTNRTSLFTYKINARAAHTHMTLWWNTLCISNQTTSIHSYGRTPLW